MERLGLVARLEGELERIISLGQLPEDGELPSEQTLASRYGVSRSTAREALLRLSARGLVVQHPGRKTRAVALDEALTLENLGMVLHGEGGLSPERRLLLDGYLSLKREVTAELLSACCEHASTAELDRLAQACFSLEDVARWGQERSRWVALEFELLRLAAAAAKRPGHLLLIQSLERAFRAISERVLPCLDSHSVAAWARFAMNALEERQVQPLRTQLPVLLEARDERVLAALVPRRAAEDMPEQLGHRKHAPEREQSAQASGTAPQPPKVEQPVEATSITPPPAEVWLPGELSSIAPHPAEVWLPGELSSIAPHPAEAWLPGAASGTATLAPEVPQPGGALGTAKQAPEVGPTAPEPTEAGVSGARCSNLYGCQTGSCEAQPPAPLPAPVATAAWPLPSEAMLKAAPAPCLLGASVAHASASPEGRGPRSPQGAGPRSGTALSEGAHPSEDLPNVEPVHGSPNP
jgi:DNA-binding FadR family transcriptional regulator